MIEHGKQPTQEILAGKGLTLKPVTVADSKVMFDLIELNRQHLSQFGDTTSRKYPTLKSVRERNLKQSENEKRFGMWHDNTFVGLVKVTREIENDWEIGYWMGKEYQGRGFMTKAVVALTDYAFTNLDADRVFATVHSENDPSVGVLKGARYTPDVAVQPTDTDVFYSKTKPHKNMPQIEQTTN